MNRCISPSMEIRLAKLLYCMLKGWALWCLSCEQQSQCWVLCASECGKTSQEKTRLPSLATPLSWATPYLYLLPSPITSFPQLKIFTTFHKINKKWINIKSNEIKNIASHTILFFYPKNLIHAFILVYKTYKQYHVTPRHNTLHLTNMLIDRKNLEFINPPKAECLKCQSRG